MWWMRVRYVCGEGRLEAAGVVLDEKQYKPCTPASPLRRLYISSTGYINPKKAKKQLPAIITYDSQLIFHYINT